MACTTRAAGARRTGRRLEPFSWQTGCGAFGRLHAPGLGELLIETVRFTDREAVLVDLSDGSRRIVNYTAGAHRFAALSLRDAAVAAQMPEPVVLQVGDMPRRVDPFHSERHLSERFRELVALIFDRSLPCAFGLLKAAAGTWDGDYRGPHGEDAEQTAANVSETLARHRDWALAGVLRDQLQRDSRCDPPQLEVLLAATGWAAVLADLERTLAEYRDAPPYPLLPELHPPARPEPAQLTLL